MIRPRRHNKRSWTLEMVALLSGVIWEEDLATRRGGGSEVDAAEATLPSSDTFEREWQRRRVERELPGGTIQLMFGVLKDREGAVGFIRYLLWVVEWVSTRRPSLSVAFGLFAFLITLMIIVAIEKGENVQGVFKTRWALVICFGFLVVIWHCNRGSQTCSSWYWKVPLMGDYRKNRQASPSNKITNSNIKLSRSTQLNTVRLVVCMLKLMSSAIHLRFSPFGFNTCQEPLKNRGALTLVNRRSIFVTTTRLFCGLLYVVL